MMRTVMLALACVLVAAPPAMAKKRHAHAHAAKAKKSKRPRRLVRVHNVAPTRVAAAEERLTPAASPAAASPSASPALASPPPASPPPAAEPAPTIDRGPMGPQATDDEVPGSRMKR